MKAIDRKRVVVGCVIALMILASVPIAAWATGGDDTTMAAVEWHKQSGREGTVEGAEATLTRTDSGATVRIDTTDLRPGHAYTAWWVIVGNPEACAAHPEPCTPPEILGNPDTESQIGYATGRVAGSSGRATFGAHVGTGVVPGGWFEDRPFAHPESAEIHVVLNDHGAKLGEYMPDMIRTYRGGCTDESLVQAFPETAFAEGQPGPNSCQLWQDVIFQ